MRTPALFVGHGNPMNAIVENPWSQAWTQLAATLPRPRAILAVSAHWYVPGTHVTAMEEPPTIHDFGGFPRPLYEVQYPAPGDPTLAKRIADLLAPLPVGLDNGWGFDHGTWSVLMHLFPFADVPVVQLSLDEAQEPSYHYELGRRLRGLRDEGVMIVGSGNVVHNLHAFAWGRHSPEPYDWAQRFSDDVRERLRTRDHHALIDYEARGRDAVLSVPTPDHYLPLLYVAASQHDDEEASFPIDGVDGGSISMLTVRIG